MEGENGNLQQEKLKLEIQKITEEVRHLRRPLVLNPQFLAPISAITVGVMAFIYASVTGFWDTKRGMLENQKLVLQLDIAKFSKQKDSIRILIIKSQRNLNSLQDSNSVLKSDIRAIRKRVASLTSDYQRERLSVKKDIAKIDRLIQDEKNSEAFLKLKSLVDRLGIITRSRRDFSDEFDPRDFK